MKYLCQSLLVIAFVLFCVYGSLDITWETSATGKNGGQGPLHVALVMNPPSFPEQGATLPQWRDCLYGDFLKAYGEQMPRYDQRQYRHDRLSTEELRAEITKPQGHQGPSYYYVLTPNSVIHRMSHLVVVHGPEPEPIAQFSTMETQEARPPARELSSTLASGNTHRM